MVTPRIESTRIENRWPVAREGLPFIGAGAALTCVSVLLGWGIPAFVLGLLTCFVVYFFRDPERTPEASDGAVISPADGKVLAAAVRTDDRNPLGRSCVQVSIFMSLFNVHVNRMVADGTVKDLRYHPGRFFSADLDKASEQNERSELTLETLDGRTLVVVQVAGLVARRIVCWVEPGDRVTAGRRFGLIRFGSRLDVFLPEDTKIVVEPGNKVRAGESVLGYLSPQD
ncbi:MAG: phosphatidylserine decarboxylase family protein [Deltaproteobacteria bacterium]|nr:phosphatidylserine decarboxylase family protein [Deltaproteobacteria bacterium]